MHSKQINPRHKDVVKTRPYPAETDQYLQFNTLKNRLSRFTAWLAKVQLKLMRLHKTGVDLLIGWPA